MQLTYETNRLFLSILDESYADVVRQFYEENQMFFAPYEAAYPDNFFTTDYQAFLLRAYLQQFLKSEGLRYHLFEKTDPERIIGCVAFSHIRLGEERSCIISYKLAMDKQHLGYATEAIRYLIPILSEEFSMHRIEADILPNNVNSVRLARQLGFEYEGIAKSSHRIQGIWRDHARYALILKENGQKRF